MDYQNELKRPACGSSTFNRTSVIADRLDHVGAHAGGYSWFITVVIGIIYLDTLAIGVGEGSSADPILVYAQDHLPSSYRFLSNALGIYLNAQYTDALAVSLIDYQDRTYAFSLGLSIVR